MSKRSYFSQYESPNIVIVPTVSFFESTAKKKMKLATKNRVEGITKNARESVKGKTCPTLDKHCVLVENTNKTDNKSKHLESIIGHGKPLKFNRLKQDDASTDKLTNVNSNKEKPFIFKDVNKQVNLNDKVDEHYEPKFSIITKISKNGANSDNLKFVENTNKETCKRKLNKITREVNNNASKSKENQNISSYKVKNHSKPDDASTNKIPRHINPDKSRNCDKKNASKVSKGVQEPSTKVIKQDNRYHSYSYKHLDKNKDKELKAKQSSNENINNKSKSEPKYNKKNDIYHITTNHLSDANVALKKGNKHHIIKPKHETQNNESKDECIPTSETKISSRRKDSLTDQKRHKIQKESSKGKYNIKSFVDIKKPQINDSYETKKKDSVNKTGHSNKILKLKSSKVGSNNEKLTQEKKKKHSDKHSNSSRGKSSLDKCFENLTVTVQTQNEILKKVGSPRLIDREIKLIINLVVENSHTKTSTPDTSCSKIDDSKASSMSNSELSFLDDINIDEIVASLRQPKREIDTIEQGLKHTNGPPNEIINIDDGSNIEDNIGLENCNKNTKLDCPTVKTENHNTSNKENTINYDDEDATKFRDKSMLKQRAQTSDNNNSTILPVGNIKEGIFDNQNKNTPVDTVEDDIIEVLSDCSTVILESLDQSYNYTLEKNKISLIVDATETTIYEAVLKQNYENVKSPINQTKDIALTEVSQETLLKDPIEAQLNKMFEMCKDLSETSNTDIVDKNIYVKIDNIEEILNAPKQNPEIIASSNHNEKQDPVELKKCNKSQNDPINDRQCSLLEETHHTIKASVKLNSEIKVAESQILPTIEVKVSKPIHTKTMKSEVIKVQETKSVPLSQEDKKFIENLEERMLSYLKTQYTVTSLIRKGRFSKIYQCKDIGGLTYAIKILNNIQDRYFRGVQKENMLMNIQKEIPKDKLHCVYVINGFSVSGYWCFLMEYYPKNLHEALREYNKSFHIDTVQILAKQLIVAVTVLRSNNIVHSDIKPEHILINSKNDRLKLCGFDTSYHIQDAAIAPNIGTSNYRAPEVILGFSSGYSLDVWSTALIMYEMATNIKLFPGFYNSDILYKQMCTLGCIPYDMIQKSLFKENHFYGTSFMKRTGFLKETVKFIYKFRKSKRIQKTIFNAYDRDWSDVRTEQQRIKDLEKLASFKTLLDQMLVMHPQTRLSIEFVYANPFIYETC